MKRSSLVVFICVIQMFLSVSLPSAEAATAALQVNIAGSGQVNISIAQTTETAITSSASFSVPVITFPATIPTLVTLVASPTDPNFTFGGWNGCDSGSSGPLCVLSMTGNRTVNYTFVRGDAQVQLTINGTGGGTVTTTPAGLATNISDKAGFPQSLGLPLSLSAKASTYSVFSGWSGGGCSGTATTCNTTFVPLYNDITATFNIDSANSVLANGFPLEFNGTQNFSSIQDAYLATTKSGYIKAWAIDFNENLICTTPKNLLLQGGFNPTYDKQTGVTTMRGPLLVRSGKLIVENISISGMASDRIKPSVPTGLTATPVSINQIDLSWSPSTDNFGVAGYNIYHGTTLVKSVTGTSTSDTGLYQNAQYCYAVAAYDAAGNISDLSGQVCATTPRDTIPPTMPTGFTVTAVSPTQVNLSWTASTDNDHVYGYDVYKKFGVFLKNVVGATSTSDTGLSPGEYCYSVEAYDNAGNPSVRTAETCVITPISTPSDLTVTPVDKSSTSLLLTWYNNSSYEWGFKVERSTDNINFTEVANNISPIATQWMDSNCAPCTTYYYRVYATRSIASSLKAAGSGTTAPAAPTGVKASAGLPLFGLYLDWDASACAAKYRVYQTDNENYIYADLGATGSSLNRLDLINPTPNIYLGYRIAAVDSAGHEGSASCTTATGVPWSYATYSGDTCHAAIGWGASPTPSYIWASQSNYADKIIIGWNPVQLTWSYPGRTGTNSYATLYYVDISYDNSSWTPLFDMQASATSTTPLTLTVTTLPANTVVYFRVAVAGYPDDVAYVTGQTAASSGTVSNNLPGPMITASTYYPGLIMVGWSTVTGAASYNIQRAQDNGSNAPGTWSTIQTTSSASYNDTSVTPWVGYWYRAQACTAANGTNCGAWSAVPDFGSASAF